MSGSAIYTQISWATICILSQGLKEWICNFFFSHRVFHILEEERVLNDNDISTVACCLIETGYVVVHKGTSLHRAYLVDFNVGVGGVAG